MKFFLLCSILTLRQETPVSELFKHGSPLSGQKEELEMEEGIKTGESLPAKEDWLKALPKHRGLILSFRLILAGVFLLSSLGKLVDIERYSVDAVYNFGILPMVLARPFGLVLPFIELLCGLGLLFGVLTRLSALGAALMSLAFFIAKAIVLSEGRPIECGCFGAIVDTLASMTIFMDIPMIVMAWIVVQAPAPARHWAGFGQWLPKEEKDRFHLIW